MCGRFFFFGNNEAIQIAFPDLAAPHPLAPRYNIAPGQPVAVIPNTLERRLDHFVWGLVPSWAKEVSIGNRMINARAESLAEKPSFRAAYRRRRCLIPADGFYEWYQPAGQRTKTPLAFRHHPPRLFAFAGLWEVWSAPDGGELFTATIITTAANAFVSPFHQRMPLILAPSSYTAWLTPDECAPAALAPLLQPLPPDWLEAFPVSPLVNNARIDEPACLEPVGEVISFDTIQ